MIAISIISVILSIISLFLALVSKFEEKGNMLIIDKDKQYGFNPNYISERSYRSFEDIRIIKYNYEQ